MDCDGIILSVIDDDFSMSTPGSNIMGPGSEVKQVNK